MIVAISYIFLRTLPYINYFDNYNKIEVLYHDIKPISVLIMVSEHKSDVRSLLGRLRNQNIDFDDRGNYTKYKIKVANGNLDALSKESKDIEDKLNTLNNSSKDILEVIKTRRIHKHRMEENNRKSNEEKGIIGMLEEKLKKMDSDVKYNNYQIKRAELALSFLIPISKPDR